MTGTAKLTPDTASFRVYNVSVHVVNTEATMAQERRLVVRIEPELIEAAKVKAKAEDLTLSQVVRRFLREWIKDDPPDKREASQKKT
jgi:predicted HicB family RNase H-like nuclease